MTNRPNTHQRVIQCNGYSVYYYITGSKENEAIFFLHPAFINHHCFDKQVDFFTKEYCVVTLDFLGHGLSQFTQTKDKIDISAHHIVQIMLAEGITKAHIAGVSMGSLIAQHFAMLYPEKTKSIIVLGGYDITADNKAVAKAQQKEIFKWIFKIIFSMKSFRRYVANTIAYSNDDKNDIYNMACDFKRKSLMVMSGLGKITQKRDDYTPLCPILLLVGEKDLELAKTAAEAWHNKQPSALFYKIPNAGHCANMHNADEFNKVVKAFISAI